MIPETVRALVSTGPLAHLTTLNSNGSPQVTVVWVGIQDDEFVTAHRGEYRKIKNIRGRVALSFLGKARTPQGLLEYVVAYGTARVAVDLLTRLARIYIGPEAHFPPPHLRKRLGFGIHIRPDRFGGIGPWAANSALAVFDSLRPATPSGLRGDRREAHQGRLPMTGRFGPLDRMRDAGPAIADHPDVAIIASAVQLATSAVLLDEGVERGQDLGHEAQRYHE